MALLLTSPKEVRANLQRSWQANNDALPGGKWLHEDTDTHSKWQQRPDAHWHREATNLNGSTADWQTQMAGDPEVLLAGSGAQQITPRSRNHHFNQSSPTYSPNSCTRGYSPTTHAVEYPSGPNGMHLTQVLKGASPVEAPGEEGVPYTNANGGWHMTLIESATRPTLPLDGEEVDPFSELTLTFL